MKRHTICWTALGGLPWASSLSYCLPAGAPAWPLDHQNGAWVASLPKSEATHSPKSEHRKLAWTTVPLKRARLWCISMTERKPNPSRTPAATAEGYRVLSRAIEGYRGVVKIIESCRVFKVATTDWLWNVAKIGAYRRLSRAIEGSYRVPLAMAFPKTLN